MMRKVKNIGHLLLAILANLRYGFPSKRLTVIGVTGTDGKTTTTSLIYHILKESGEKVAMITSVGAYIGDKLYDIGFHVTTPSSFAVQKYLRQAADTGNNYVVLETTSHALDQSRVWGVEYTVGVLTNITHEHLDYHPTYEDYVATKRKLLDAAPIVVVNKDDQSYQHIASALTQKEVVTYSLTDQTATLTPKKFPFTTKLLGEFNYRNSLAAIGATQKVGIAATKIRQALKSFTPPPGRQEIVYDKEFMVMIDFAHTPNSFAQILPELKKIAKGRVIHVFGSAGLRDHTKRPLMGRESAATADIIVLTAEDPRIETVADINRAVLSGIPKSWKRVVGVTPAPTASTRKVVYVVADRTEAIQFAVASARKGDVVVCTGKSHEKSMNYGHGEVPWDEFATVKSALTNRNRKTAP